MRLSPPHSLPRRLCLSACLLASGAALATAAPAAAAPVGALDSSCSPTGAAGFVPFWSGAKAAQTFTAVSSGNMRYVEVKAVARMAGGSGGPIDVELLGVDGAGTPVTPALATTAIPAAAVTADNVIRDLSATFDSSSAYHVVAGTTYAIALSTADSAQNVWIVRGDGCPGGIYQSFSGGAYGTPFFTFGEDAGLNVYLVPANDDFARAEVLVGSTVSLNGTTRGATGESGDSFMTEDQPSTGRSVWYRWTAPGSGPTTVDTCTTDYDSLLAVFSGSGLGALTPVVTNNNGCPSGFGSKVSFDATAGTTYQIDVDGCCGLPEGTLTLALSGPAAPPPPAPLPVPVPTPPQSSPGAHPAAGTAAPSNRFSLGRPKWKHGAAVLIATVPGPGTLEIKDAKALIKLTRVTASGAGPVKLILRPTRAGRKALKRRGRAKATVEVTYTPAGGRPNANTALIKLRRK